jgi:hypothetical protein
LSLGEEHNWDEYYALLDEALAKGWNPNRLDGQQEVMVGWELQEEMIAKYEAVQARIVK